MSELLEKLTIKNKELFFRGMILLFLDMFLVIMSMGGALWIRFDFRFTAIDPYFLEEIKRYICINIICTLLINNFMRLYTSLWRFASVVELKNIICAVLLSTGTQILGMKIMHIHVPKSYPILYLMIFSVLMATSRFSYRFTRISMQNYQNLLEKEPVRTMLIGAGSAGCMIANEIKNSKHLNRKILCIIDDDPSKMGTYLQGIQVVGRKEKIPYYAKKNKVEEIIIAIPSLSRHDQKELLEICQKTSCKIMTLPGIYQLINEEVSVSMLQEVQIEDLLGREPIQLEMKEIIDYVREKVILVTGGGGSIGSEICRQLASYRPKQLIILDIYENNAYDIQNELINNYPDLDLRVLIGSVRNQKRVDAIFEKYRPDLVFHAAAHKHVPLMENSPNEAIKNNILGTWVVAQAADRFKAKKMVFISTDKAVRPTNIMGASKRACELIIQSFAQNSDTEYAAVRFGNVLGSNGSVIPLFKKQIAEGGPVTVTHPDIIRYFMTIPEAVNLVLQCGALAREGEVFILDMGEPVKILDLAKKMIRLSGYVPNEDIEIVFTGLRPGEKLYEELIINEENIKKTAKDRIFVGHQKKVDREQIQETVQMLIQNAFDEADDIRVQIQKLVPEYVIQNDNLLKEAAVTKIN